MRLIDADVITCDKIIKYVGERYAKCAEDIEFMIDDQPTIHYCKSGRWVEDSLHWRYICSECGYASFSDADKFCRECGAKMER